MENYLMVKEAAKAAETTSETLRHYDRLGLVKPRKGENGYRYYSKEQIVVIKVAKRLQSLGFSLKEVGSILRSDSLDELLHELDKAIERCDDSLKRLKQTKQILLNARRQYQAKARNPAVIEEKEYPDRYILLSSSDKSDNLESLYDYQSLYRSELGAKFRDYAFLDQAGIYEKDGESSLFIQLAAPPSIGSDNLVNLKKGKYLIADCKKEEKTAKLRQIKDLASSQYGFHANEAAIFIVVDGILSWSYQIQVRVGPA